MLSKVTQLMRVTLISGIFTLFFFSQSAFAQPGSATKIQPGTATDVTPGGPTSYAWTTPANAIGEDAVNTISSIPGHKRSHLLQLTNFGFTAPADIPLTASISGIIVEIKKKGTAGIKDFSITILKGGVSTGTAHTLGTAWPTSLTYVTHGSSSDLWGTTWTVADITSSGFGIQIQAKNGSKNAATAEIDNVKITIVFNSTNYYSKAAGSLATFATWGTNLDGTGTAPTSFVADGQTFNLVNRAATTLDANLTISGGFSKMIVGNGTAATAFTVPAGFAYTGVADVKNLSSLILQNTSLPTLGQLETGSLVNYNAAGNQNVLEGNYSSLSITGGGTKTLLTGTNGNTDVSADLTIAAATIFNLNYPVAVEGNFSNNGTTGGTNEITMDAAIAQTVSGTGTIKDLAIDNSAGGATQVTFSGAQSFITYLRCINGVVGNGVNFIPLAGCVLNIEDGSINSAIASANAYDVLYTSTISKSTANELTGSGLRNVTLNLFDNTITITAGANFAMSGSMLLTAGILNASTRTISIGGDLTNNSTLTQATSTFVFTGSTAVQNIGGSSPITFNNITLNKASGRAQLQADASASATLTLTSGIMNTNNFIFTMLGTGASFSPAITLGAARTSFISTAQSSGADATSGGLQIQSIGSGGRTGNVVFPVGNSFTSYNPVQVNNTGTSDNYLVNVKTGVPAGALLNDCVNRTWNIAESVAGGSSATIGMQWGGSDEGVTFIRLVARVFHSDGTQIDFAGNPASAAGSDPYNTSGAPVGGFTTFSPYGVGSNLIVLPVSLNNISARIVAQGVEIKWKNLAERDVRQYFVERSLNGRDFQSVSSQVALLNNGSAIEYKLTDNTIVNNDVFYRIKAEDISGKITISSVVHVRKNSFASIAINPNPVQDRVISLSLNSIPTGKYNVIVSDAQGRSIMRSVVTSDGSFNVIKLNLPSTATKGYYTLKLADANGNSYTEKCIVQ